MIEYIKESLLVGRSVNEDEGEDEDSQEENKSDEEFQDLMKTTDIESMYEIFLNMRQNKRVSYVIQPEFPNKRWVLLTHYISGSESRKEQWGILNDHINTTGEGTVICLEHDEKIPVVERELERREASKSVSTNNYSSKTTGKIGADAKVLKAKSEKELEQGYQSEQSNSNSDATRIYFYECSTNKAHCRLNRESFIRIGDECMARGKDRLSYLNEAWKKEKERIGAESQQSDVSEEAS